MNRHLNRILTSIFLILFTGYDEIKIDNQLYRYDAEPVVVTAKKEISNQKVFDYQLLARLVNAEAGNESFEGMHAVADVVVHIANHKGWSIEQVIYDKGRFDGIRTRRFFVEPSRDCYEAARRSLVGIHILPKSVHFFFNPRTSTDTKWINYISKFAYRNIGNHLFCYNPHAT